MKYDINSGEQTALITLDYFTFIQLSDNKEGVHEIICTVWSATQKQNICTISLFTIICI